MRNMFSGRTTRRNARSAIAVAIALLMLGSANAGAAETCRNVQGYFNLVQVAGADCTSPVGVCTRGNFSGDIRGAYYSPFFTITETAETPNTGVVLFTAQTVITGARIGARSGHLVLSEGGAYSTPDGAFGQLFTVSSGTGGLAGASGTLRGMGTYLPESGGGAAYAGKICVPVRPAPVGCGEPVSCIVRG